MAAINLAPHHKWGLLVDNPVLLAGGTIGYGEALHRGVNTEQLGGVVIGPIMRHSRSGRDGPRLAETNSGFVLNTGLQNRGIGSALRRFASLWSQLGCPVIAQVADTQADALAHVVRRLDAALAEGVELHGIELLLPSRSDEQQTRALVHEATRHSGLPLWVKLPLKQAASLSTVAVDAGASGLVIGQPPLGTLHHGATPVTGGIHGPLAFAPMLAALHAVRAQQLPCALIACGGIHTLAQARQALSAGADALQIDSALWVEPGLPAFLAAALAGDE
jgi:dihydroorotate dehydrogenase (NAD+) catalytic subunit